MSPHLASQLDAAEDALDRAVEHLLQARFALSDGLPEFAASQTALCTAGLREALDALTVPDAVVREGRP